MMVHRIAVTALLILATSSEMTTTTAFTADPMPTHIQRSSHSIIDNNNGPLIKHSSIIECKAAATATAASSSSYDDDNDNDSDNDAETTTTTTTTTASTIEILPSFITSPVLSQVYSALIAHKAEYGNPNIPLGSTNGKKCKTLRRLHFQNKLSDEETRHLTELGFLFHSFEDVYYECDFDEMLGKLLDYRDEFRTYQIPKKYEPDPELGAWVTMLRRLRGKDELPPSRIERMDDVGFEWISTRKCGSSFMANYRDAATYLTGVAETEGDARELSKEEEEEFSRIRKWVEAQRCAYEKGNLSEQRAGYMDELPGIDWRNPTSWA